MTALVTGATGFTGGHLARHLLQIGRARGRDGEAGERGARSRPRARGRGGARRGFLGRRGRGCSRQGLRRRLSHRGDVPRSRARRCGVHARQRRRHAARPRRRARRGSAAGRALQHRRRARSHRAAAGERERAVRARRRLPAHQARSRTAGDGVRDRTSARGGDCPADRHLRARRPPLPEDVSRHRARPVSDAGIRGRLLPPHLYRRSRPWLRLVRTRAGGGRPHLHSCWPRYTTLNELVAL